MNMIASKRLAAIDEMLKKRPDDPFVHYARAMELRSLGAQPDALTSLVEVSRRFPNYVPTYLMAAQLASELGSSEMAATLADAGIAAATRSGDEHALSELRTFRATLSSGGAEGGKV